MKSNELSLRTLTLSSVTWYGSVLSGWALVLVAGIKLAMTDSIHLAPAFVMTAALLLVLELLPLVQGRGHDPQGVVMSTAFVCAMLFEWGLWPAIVMVAVASLASDMRAGKNWWKTAFNPAQYALSVGAASLVRHVMSTAPSLAHPLNGFTFADLLWVAAAWVTYFVVNLALVCGVLTYSDSFKALFFDDFWHMTAMTFSVLALSPLVVLTAERQWGLMPLLLIPLLLLYWTAQMSLAREEAAGHDALTGLPNRSSLHFELDTAIATYRRDETPFGLMVIDLDDFKRVNDTLGHLVGDELLVKFSDRLERSVRPGDHVARLGGDEFAVIVFDADEAQVKAVAERIQDSLSNSIDLGDLALETDLSLGIAICPEHGTDSTTLLRRADVAMYHAKELRSQVEVYSPQRDHNSADRLSLLGELRQAILDDALELYYQPKVLTRDSAPMGVEALVRWRHPDRGFVPPDEFIPLAERSGIMPLLTAHVLDIALRQSAAWRDQDINVPIAVNIAPTDLSGDGLTTFISTRLAEHDLDPSMLELEITERIVTHQLEDAANTLRHLRGMGVRISLDDFGTGYSSLLRLSSLPVDEIKIDRVFVSALSQGTRATGIVQAVVDLAHALGMPVIAEGVENEQELGVLGALGCDGAQGWHVAMPMPAAEATDWLRNRLGLPPLRRPMEPRTAQIIAAADAYVALVEPADVARVSPNDQGPEYVAV